jgi:type VI secretion system secreted protein Hcp
VMGLWARAGRLTRAVLLLAVGAAGGGTALAVASVPDSNGVIHACYSVDGSGNAVTSTSNLTVIDAGQTCPSSPAGGPHSQALNWNVQGSQGPAGQPGPQGPPGNTATIVKGGTLTLSGGQVLTVESAGGGVTVPTPTTPVGGGSDAVVGSGKGALSFPILEVLLLSSHAGGGSAGTRAGKVAVHDISITKKLDKASPTLALSCASGQHFKQVTITLRKKGKPYLRYTLSDVLVAAVQASGHSNDATPTETITFNSSSLQIAYLAQKSTHHGLSQTKTKVHLP